MQVREVARRLSLAVSQTVLKDIENVHTHIYTQTHIHIHTHTHIRIYTHTHTYIYPHIHIYMADSFFCTVETNTAL